MLSGLNLQRVIAGHPNRFRLILHLAVILHTVCRVLRERTQGLSQQRVSTPQGFEPCEAGVIPCGRVNWHALHYGKGLHGGITDGVKHVVTDLGSPRCATRQRTCVQHGRITQVMCWYGVGVLYAAGQMGSLGSHISKIKQNLPRKAPLDSEAPILNIRQVSPSGEGAEGHRTLSVVKGWTLSRWSE